MSEAQKSSSGIELPIILVFILAVKLSPIVDIIKNYFNSLKQSYSTYFFTFLIFVVLFFIINFIYRKIRALQNRIVIFKEEKLGEQKEANEIEKFMRKYVPEDKQSLTTYTEFLKDLIKRARCNRYAVKFVSELKERLAEAKKRLEKIERYEEVKEREEKIWILDRQIEEKEEENRLKISQEEPDLDSICYLLKSYEIPVFIKSRLTKNQIKALERDGFRQINEYSLIEQKFIRILVKSRTNHSKTHTFLVWDAIRLLKKIKGISNLREHETVEADITFKFNNHKYALEIETGTLLGKKKQTQEKIDYLNKKYRKRWMFIISNKNLLSKYNELGFTTTRKRVSEDLGILLEK